ncbi:MAG: universal stress protein [Candidatus Nitrosotenuis sp.]
MSEYHSILVPYDDSKHARKSLDESLKIAKKFDSELYLLTVIDALAVAPSSFYKNPDTMEAKKLEKYLKSKFSKIDKVLGDAVYKCKEAGVSADYEIVVGTPVNVILMFAKKKKVDLIVMGSQGLTGFDKLKALGSVSRKVSEMAECPVLIVR